MAKKMGSDASGKGAATGSGPAGVAASQVANGSHANGAEKKQPRCLALAEKGVSTGSEFAAMMAALISDVICGDVTPQVANAAVNAGGKLLKVVEMQKKYGTPQEPSPTFKLT